MATTKLKLYNAALLLLKQRKLASLTEDQEARHVLDDVWDRGNGAVRHCLEQGLWNFAIRARSLEHSASIEPAFGYQRAFEKPDDFVRLDMISADEYFSDPLTAYESEQSYWFADVTPLYVRYISDDSQYGADYSLWPESFTRFVEAYLATEAAPGISASMGDDVAAIQEDRLKSAKSKDAMNEPARFAPPGSWSRARHGRSSSRERGVRSRLYG